MEADWRRHRRSSSHCSMGPVLFRADADGGRIGDLAGSKSCKTSRQPAMRFALFNRSCAVPCGCGWQKDRRFGGLEVVQDVETAGDEAVGRLASRTRSRAARRGKLRGGQPAQRLQHFVEGIDGADGSACGFGTEKERKRGGRDYWRTQGIDGADGSWMDRRLDFERRKESDIICVCGRRATLVKRGREAGYRRREGGDAMRGRREGATRRGRRDRCRTYDDSPVHSF